MDLSSGYLILEGIGDDRRFDTWFGQAMLRLKALNVNDCVKVLIKLAVTVCPLIGGGHIFHAQQDASR